MEIEPEEKKENTEEINNEKKEEIIDEDQLHKLLVQQQENVNEIKEDEGAPISGMVNQTLANQLIEMGYSKNVSEKSLFLNQQILEKAIEWIYENQNSPDFEEELKLMAKTE